MLLPLYPQYSTTTTGSSLLAWRQAAARGGLAVRTTTLCCYPTDAAYVRATAAIVRTAYEQARSELDPAVPLRVLFSAHGLPEVIVRRGDPYQWQIEQTVAAVEAELGALVAGATDRPHHLLSVARDAAEMDRPQHRQRDRAGGEGQDGGSGGADRLRLRPHGNPGGT